MFEPLAVEAMAALAKSAPDIVATIKALPAAMKGAVTASGTNSGVGVEASVASNLSKHMPSVTADMYAKIKTIIGNAIAVFETTNVGVKANSQGAWAPIMASVTAGIATLGLDVSKFQSNTMTQMVSSGIEMYAAGLGTRAVVVAAPNAD